MGHYYYQPNIKWLLMRKRIPRIGRRLMVDKWSRNNYPLPDIPYWIYSRHFRRRTVYRYRNGTGVIDVGNGWYIHSFRNGGRMLSVLPF